MIGLISGLLLIAYFAVLGKLVEKPLVIFFHFNKTYRSKILGAFFAFIFASWLSGLAVVFYKLDLIISIAVLVLTGLASVLVHLVFRKYDVPDPTYVPEVTPNYDLKWLHISLVTLFSILLIYGFYLLKMSWTESAVFSPWQTIKPSFIYVFALAAMVVALLIYTRFSHKYTLLVIIALSFLQHSYLPLTSDLIYGADNWRHISTEERIYRGETVEPPKISDATIETQLTTIIGRVAYSQLWGMSVLLSKVLSVDLININKWLLPVLWSVLLPILLYESGRSFGWSRRKSSVLVWLSFLPFAWQVGGSFTLPVNFGFLFWLFAQLLMFKRSERQEDFQLSFLFAIGIMISFGYSLYALIFWAGMALFELIHWRLDFTRAQVGLMVLFGIVLLPLIEWKFGYSFINSSTAMWDGVKQATCSLTGYYLAAGPRPHDITAGNIIINETPSYAYVSNLFTAFRWWIVGFMVAFWLLFIYGLRLTMSKGFDSLPDYPGNAPVNIYRSNHCWLLVFGSSLFFGYIISRYFLPGEHLLTRRLDPMLAFLVLTIFFVAISALASLEKYRIPIIVAFILGSAALAASYSLGPDTRNVSSDEYRAATYISEQVKNDDKYCVVGDTYVLLALESLTRGKVVGGGFPITHNFEQPELSKLQMNLNDISVVEVKYALRTTGAPYCFLITKTDGPISYYIKNGNASSTQFGGITIWKYSN
jgi:hypothetical protein